MIFKTSFRVLSNNEIFLNDFVKFWKYSAKFLIKKINDSDEFSIWVNISFSLFFFKICFVDFFEIFLSNLNDILINFLDDFLFLNKVLDVVNLINWNVRDIFAKFFIRWWWSELLVRSFLLFQSLSKIRRLSRHNSNCRIKRSMI
jgi:hypothetical protein